MLKVTECIRYEYELSKVLVVQDSRMPIQCIFIHGSLLALHQITFNLLKYLWIMISTDLPVSLSGNVYHCT